MAAAGSQVPQRHVIVGGGIAGVAAAEELARLRPQDSITLLSASRSIRGVANFVRLTDSLETFDVVDRPLDFLSTHAKNVSSTVAHVTALDCAAQLVHCSDGRSFPYDKLLVATGAVPAVILQHPTVLGVRDTDSVGTLSAQLGAARRALLVGNGAIACELAHAARPCAMVWAVKDAYLGHTFFDASAAEFFEALPPKAVEVAAVPPPAKRARGDADAAPAAVLGNALGPKWTSLLPPPTAAAPPALTVLHGVEVHAVRAVTAAAATGVLAGGEWVLAAGATAGALPLPAGEAVDSDGCALQALLTDGSLVAVDVIVSATGVLAQTAWAAAGGALPTGAAGGLCVNKHMQVGGQPCVFAAGDAACVQWPHAPVWFQMRTWSQARLAGTYAAWCMGGHVEGVGSTADSMAPLPTHGSPLERLTAAHSALDAGQEVEEGEEDIMVGGGAFELFAHMTSFMGHKVVLLGLFNGQGMGPAYRAAIEGVRATAGGAEPGGSGAQVKAVPADAAAASRVQVLYRVTPGVEYVKLVLLDGRVVGAMLIGETDLEETAENLVHSRLNVGALDLDLLHPDVDLEDFFD